jgi:hypothetical protein
MAEIKLVIGVPTTGLVSMGFAYSLCGMTSFIAAGKIKSRPEASIEVSMDVQESSVIHTNREQIVSRAIERGATHLLFLDHDMVFEPQIIDVLFSRRQEVVCTNYLIKSDEPQFVAVGLDGNRVPTREDSTGLVPIAYSGFGVSLFEVKAFKRTPQPWFQPEFVPSANQYTTEDNPCYRRLREAGAEVYLDQDASKLVSGHVGLKGWHWREWSRAKPAADLEVSRGDTGAKIWG